MKPGSKKAWGRTGKSGQAITELVVALVVLLVLVAGLIQISGLGLLQTGTMIEARREAGVQAMQDASPFSGPDYIANHTVGPDGSDYSRDDGVVMDAVRPFQDGIVWHSDPAALDQQVKGNLFTAMWEGSFPYLFFGLVEGKKTDSMDLLPIVRNLLYRADTVDVEGKAWLTWTKGIY